MEKVLGQEGIVTEIDEKGDANVEVGEVKWWFNPAVLILESKEEEREPAGKSMTDDAKDGAGEDESAALAVVRESSKKSLKEELLEDLPEVLATGKEVAKEVMSKVTEGFEKLCDNARKKLIAENIPSTSKNALNKRVTDLEKKVKTVEQKIKEITSITDEEPVEYFGILFTDRYFDDLPEDIFYIMSTYLDDKDIQWIGEGPWEPEKFLLKFPKEGYERKDCLQYLFEVLNENFPVAMHKLLGLLTVGKELVTTPLEDNQELKEKTIEIVSRNPICCWETLAGHLQVDERIVKKCREDYSGDTHELTSQMLREWIETSDKSCTLEIIFDALRLCEYKETGIELATYTTEKCRIQLHS